MKKNIISIVALILIQLSLSNCAYIYSKSGNVAAKIKTLEEQQQYGMALQTLSFIKKNHHNYEFLMSEKSRITLLAKKYEDRTLKQAAIHTVNKHWSEAMNLYDSALENLPESKKLRSERSRFIIKRDNYLKQLENKLLVSNAKTLSKKTATTKEIAQVNPNDKGAKKLLSTHIREVELTADKLITCAEDGVKSKDIQLAEECLALASNLSTSKSINKKIKKLQSIINKERKSRQKRHKKSINKITMNLEHVKTNKELLHYKKEVMSYYQQDKKNKKLIQLKKELNTRIENTVKMGIKQGQELYSQGRIEQALNQWKELQQLQPSHAKLNDYIHRAERVLKKLQSLGNNLNSVPPLKKSN